jgi:hypothetical protein
MAKTATLKSATASVRKAKARKPSRRAAEEAAEREEDERARFWSDLDEKGRQRLPAIVTMEDLIVALGGPRAVGEWLKTTPENIRLMSHRGYVARGYHLHVYLALTRLGYQHINSSLFGLVGGWGSLLPQWMRLPELPAA